MKMFAEWMSGVGKIGAVLSGILLLGSGASLLFAPEAFAPVILAAWQLFFNSAVLITLGWFVLQRIGEGDANTQTPRNPPAPNRRPAPDAAASTRSAPARSSRESRPPAG